jgi:hypothetical protein
LPVFRFLAGPVAAIVLVSAYNYIAFASVAGGYPVRLTGRFWDGLAGVLVSPGRGLLVYTPLVLFALCAGLPQARAARRQNRAVFVACTVFTLLQIAIAAKWETWWGGYCWGPRLVTETLAPAMVLIALAARAMEFYRLKNAFLAVAVYCCSIQVLGVFFYPKGKWDHLPISVNDAPGRLWNWSDNPIVRTAKGGPAWEPYAIVWTAVTHGLPAARDKLREYGVNPY